MIRFALLLAVFISGIGMARAEGVVSICSEPGDGPPWLYWKKSSSATAPNELAGFTMDLMQAAFARIGKTVVFRGDLPWSRCLKMVAAKEIDYASGAYYSQDRAQVYSYSKPYKTLTPQVFMRADSSVKINATGDLRQYRGCGMIGSSYAHYGLTQGDLNQGIRSYASLIEMLKMGRCDYFVEELEVVAQLNAGRDRYLQDPMLRHNDIVGATRPAMHLIAAKDSPAALLLPPFDDAFQKMLKAGEVQKLWKKNAGDLVF